MVKQLKMFFLLNVPSGVLVFPHDEGEGDRDIIWLQGIMNDLPDCRLDSHVGYLAYLYQQRSSL